MTHVVKVVEKKKVEKTVFNINCKYKMPFKYTMFRRKILAAKYFWKSIHSRAKPLMFLFSILRRKRSAKL